MNVLTLDYVKDRLDSTHVLAKLRGYHTSVSTTQGNLLGHFIRYETFGPYIVAAHCVSETEVVRVRFAMFDYTNNKTKTLTEVKTMQDFLDMMTQIEEDL